MDRGDPLVTPIALTIAGSDSGGGAGIQADLKTFAALGVYGASAVTALTAQNTRGVRAIHLAPVEIVLAQIDAVLADFDVAAIKIGMLGSVEIVEAVAERLRAVRLDGPTPDPSPQTAGRGEGRAAPPLPVLTGRGRGWGGSDTPPFIVYDPVMIASSGDALAGAGFIEAIRSQLLPLVDCLTPNLAEAAALLDAPVASSEHQMAEQSMALAKLGPRAVLVKGGHLVGEWAVDMLYTDAHVLRYASTWVKTRNLHGTGCTLSSAIAAHIVLGQSLIGAVHPSKIFTHEAIAAARSIKLGGGPGPLIQYTPRRKLGKTKPSR
jgi:hydroxymethylpyrimidine/phosphomethylpyrimidine kinase